MHRRRWPLPLVVLALPAAPVPARAGTDDVVSCGAPGADGVNRARLLRVLVDGREAQALRPACDCTAMVPCAQVAERPASLSAFLADGRHTVGVEATDTGGHVARGDLPVAVDRDAPGLAFVPHSRGRGIAVGVADAGSGVTGGTIEARRRGQRAFRPLPTRLRGARLVARLARGSRAATTLRCAVALPESGTLVELQAFDRGRRRVFATTRARGARAGRRTSCRFGPRAGSDRIRARIRREGTIPFDLGYARPVRVTVR